MSSLITQKKDVKLRNNKTTVAPKFNLNAQLESKARKERLIELITNDSVSCEDIAKKFGLPLDAIYVAEGPKNDRY